MDSKALEGLAWSFVKQYYHLLLHEQSKLAPFYDEDSTFTHAEGSADGERKHGKAAIAAAIADTKYATVNIGDGAVDAQLVGKKDEVLLLVSGLMGLTDNSVRPFSQAFVLAKKGDNFYVRNDVLRVFNPPSAGAMIGTLTATATEDETSPGNMHVSTAISAVVEAHLAHTPEQSPVISAADTAPAPVSASAPVVSATATTAAPATAAPGSSKKQHASRGGKKPAAGGAGVKETPAPAPVKEECPKSWASVAKANTNGTAPATSNTTAAAVTSDASPAAVATASASPTTGAHAHPSPVITAVFVKGTAGLNKDDLRSAFAKYGKIVDVVQKLPGNHAHVDFDSATSATAAAAVKTVKIKDVSVEVELARPRKEAGAAPRRDAKKPSPGAAGGAGGRSDRRDKPAESAKDHHGAAGGKPRTDGARPASRRGGAGKPAGGAPAVTASA